jgi:hypothetical protein
MKKKKKTMTGMFSLTVWIVLLVILAVSAASGQYELSWYTIDGGGGQSAGGQYKLIGTIGQPDAAWSSGGGYELLGGFLTGGPLCFVNFEHFARFAQYWLEPGTGSPADLYEDLINDEVNKLDLRVFVDLWLCYCPENWPLK